MFERCRYNFCHKLFKPLLLLFYMGFLIRLFKTSFELSNAIYKVLAKSLLVSIDWQGGEGLAFLSATGTKEVLSIPAVPMTDHQTACGRLLA
jgi:hypothetical protein